MVTVIYRPAFMVHDVGMKFSRRASILGRSCASFACQPYIGRTADSAINSDTSKSSGMNSYFSLARCSPAIFYFSCNGRGCLVHSGVTEKTLCCVRDAYPSITSCGGGHALRQYGIKNYTVESLGGKGLLRHTTLEL